MSITKERKATLVKEYGSSKNDTGSTGVQCAILTERIKNLTEYFKLYKKDFHSKRGLIMMVEKRRKLINFLKRINYNGYLDLIKKLGMRK